MRILFVETDQAEFFSPIALARPVFELLCGTRSVRQRIIDTLQPDSWGVIVRPHLEDVYRSEHPEAFVNDPEWLVQTETILVNGLWVGDPNLLKQLSADDPTLHCNGSLVAMFQTFTEEEVVDDKLHLAILSILSMPTNLEPEEPDKELGIVLKHPWDLIKNNADAIHLDFQLLRYNEQQVSLPAEITQTVSSPEERANIFIDPSAELEPFVSINAKNGPVIIEAGVKIQSFTRLEGPCFIGEATQLFRANIREETSIGPVCRVGGEIEGSIIHGYANKYHDGFLGHSYVCPWVNLGAQTSNSDLKNDYSDVKVPIGTDYIDSGDKKVGCFIGDHAKTAIGTLFNTGSNIGVMAMVLPAGKLCPKHIPSFARLWHGKLDNNAHFEANCQTAKTAMGRRDQTFTDTHRKLFESIQKLTEPERKDL